MEAGLILKVKLHQRLRIVHWHVHCFSFQYPYIIPQASDGAAVRRGNTNPILRLKPTRLHEYVVRKEIRAAVCMPHIRVVDTLCHLLVYVYDLLTAVKSVGNL